MPGFVLPVIKDARALGQVVDLLGRVEGGVFDLGLGAVLEGVEVEARGWPSCHRPWFSCRSLGRICCRGGRCPPGAAQIGGLKDRLALVVRAVVFHAIGHMDQRVESDHVAGAEGGALRAAHGRSGELVHRLNAQAHVLNGVEQRLDGKHAHAVGNKGRGVLAEHRGLAQPVAAVGHKEVDQARGRFRRAG